jgi:predicted enzyme related to lactoylglutathione lyase
VADADATVAKATELGGQVLVPVMPTPQGPMAILADPQGGVFAVIASGSTE